MCNVSVMQTPAPGPRQTLALDSEVWSALTKAAGLTTDRKQAEALGFTREALSRVRNGHAAPGPEFIAAVRGLFPHADIHKVFRLVDKVAS